LRQIVNFSGRQVNVARKTAAPSVGVQGILRAVECAASRRGSVTLTSGSFARRVTSQRFWRACALWHTLAGVRTACIWLGLMLSTAGCGPNGEPVEAVDRSVRQTVESPPALGQIEPSPMVAAQAPSPTDTARPASPALEASEAADEATATPEQAPVEAEAEDAVDPVRERYCTPSAVRHARSGRGLRCPRCARYDVVPSSRGRYVSCHCGFEAPFSGFVHVHQR